MDVTYYVALPFVLADDGVAQERRSSALAPTPPSCEPKRCRATWLRRCRRVFADGRSGHRRRQADPQIRRGAGRPERLMTYLPRLPARGRLGCLQVGPMEMSCGSSAGELSPGHGGTNPVLALQAMGGDGEPHGRIHFAAR